MPKITSSNEIETFFIEKLKEKFNKKRDGIHVSDLVYCLRKPFFRKLIEQDLTIKQLVYFLDGVRRHEGLQDLVPEYEKEKEISKYGVIGHVDLSSGVPIEIKTTRAKSKLTIPPHYMTQGAYYCILMDKTKFILITQHINDGDITFEEIEFTEEELEEYKKKMFSDKKILENAFSKIPEVKELSTEELLKFLDSIGLKTAPIDLKWMCTSCEYKHICYLSENKNV